MQLAYHEVFSSFCNPLALSVQFLTVSETEVCHRLQAPPLRPKVRHTCGIREEHVVKIIIIKIKIIIKKKVVCTYVIKDWIIV